MKARTRYPMRQFLHLSNLATSGNLAAGFLAVLLISRAELRLAAIMVIISAVLDAVDGPVARATGAQSQFGSNLDSLADIVSFAVAPAYATYVGSLHSLPAVGVVACLGFVLCSAWRLARFPLCKDPHYFVGCPVPVAGVTVMLLAALRPHPIASLATVVALSLLMVSTLPVPTFSRIRSVEIRRLRPTSGVARRTRSHRRTPDATGGPLSPVRRLQRRPHRSARRARLARRREGRRSKRQRREAA